MTVHQWTAADIPDLTGRRALVTGATSGLGEQTVLELARNGAEVVLTGRDPQRLARATSDVLRACPTAHLVPLHLDLADLTSVRRAAEAAATLGPLHLLVNNAGVMATPNRRTVDGFDLQLGTNHLGHFALTGLLWPRLVESGDARVVTVSSLMHRSVRTVPLTDPRLPTPHYQKWIAYGQSKLANLLFAFELDRRARAAGAPVASLAAHPGYASTNLVDTGPNLDRRRADGTILVAATRLLGQRAEQGALPTLMAATMPGLPGGTYCGPKGLGEVRGLPKVVRASRPARDETLAAALWDVSEDATRIHFP